MVETMKNYIDYERQAELLKVLSHPIRLQIIHDLLAVGCRNVRCMESHIGMSHSCISQHLQRLRAAGLVAAERSGNENLYGLPIFEGLTFPRGEPPEFIL